MDWNIVNNPGLAISVNGVFSAGSSKASNVKLYSEVSKTTIDSELNLWHITMTGSSSHCYEWCFVFIVYLFTQHEYISVISVMTHTL